MSFILDALKKSDKKRQDGTVPNLVTSHKMETESKQRRPLWALLLVLLLVVNVAVLLWLFGPWSLQQTTTPHQADLEIAGEKNVSAGSVAQAEVKLSPPDRGSEPLVEPVAGSSQAVKNVGYEAKPLAEAVAEAEPQNAASSLQQQVSPADVEIVAETQETPVHVSAEAQPPRIYELSDLPPSVRHDIPEMHIAMHAYYLDAQKRLVSINNKLLREGGTLHGKYLLEEITVDGVIFSYAGYRFHVLFKSSKF